MYTSLVTAQTYKIDLHKSLYSTELPLAANTELPLVWKVGVQHKHATALTSVKQLFLDQRSFLMVIVTYGQELSVHAKSIGLRPKHKQSNNNLQYSNAGEKL